MSVAIVTGAAGGIGRAIGERLGRSGHTLVAVDVASSLADAVLALESLNVRAIPVQADLTTEAGISAVVDAAAQAGDVRVLVNNAGITADARLVNMTQEQFDRVIAVNLEAPYALSEALRPHLVRGSSIVNIASRAYLGNFGQFNYSMSKGGIVGLTRAHALEWSPDVRVNAVAPGLINTDMAQGIPDDVLGAMVDAIPMARMGETDEVADLVAFLASGRSGYITGGVHIVGGGRSLSR